MTTHDKNTHRMEKRITHEIVQLIEYERTRNTPRTIRQTDDSTIIKIGKIVFKITKDYPFHPPIVYINQQSYLQFSVPQNIHIRNIYNQLLSLSNCCLWCQSIIHTNNWRLYHRLFTIMLEIEQINHVKRQIREILIFKRYIPIICEKYNLPMYRDIENYLYDTPLRHNTII
jgi:hypothetical protein